MSKQETVQVTVTVELTKEQNDFFEGLSKFVRKSVEEMFNEEMRSLVENFVDGGFLDAWMEDAISQYGADLFKTKDKKKGKKES